MDLLVAIPPLVFGAVAFVVGRGAPVVAAALVVWGALLVALFASGGGDFGLWVAVGPWLALTTASVAGAVLGGPGWGACVAAVGREGVRPPGALSPAVGGDGAVT